LPPITHYLVQKILTRSPSGSVLPEAFFGGVNGENVRKNVDRRQKGGDAFPR
jgi:hypothetical protein